jgi:hypothetical protein
MKLGGFSCAERHCSTNGYDFELNRRGIETGRLPIQSGILDISSINEQA